MPHAARTSLAHFVLFVLFVGIVSAGCGSGVDPPPEAFENHAPLATLRVPQLAQVGAEVVVDASGSSDVDVDADASSDALHAVFGFGDGTPAAESDDLAFAHVYADAGSFVVSVDVNDDHGGSAHVDLDIVVVEGAVEACDCDVACADDAACAVDHVCVVLAASDGTTPALAPAEAIACDAIDG